MISTLLVRKARMPRRFAIAASVTAAVAAAIVLSTAASASAHIEATATDTAADSYTTMTFSVPHGCNGSPTTALQFHVPSSVIEVTPTVNPNWTISRATEPYTDPSASSNDENPEDAGQRVTSVSYTAKTPLPADDRDTFALSFSLPDGKAGDTVSFPVTQTCEKGTVEWNQAQKAGQAEPEHPAPSITLTAASTAADHHGDTSAQTASAAPTASPSTHPDVVARVLGIAGLVVGAIGIVSAVAVSRRRAR